MSKQPKQITQEDFERLMVKIVNQDPASYLFAIPAVWEAVSNDPQYRQWVEDDWAIEQEDLEGVDKQDGG